MSRSNASASLPDPRLAATLRQVLLAGIALGPSILGAHAPAVRRARLG